MVGDEAAFWQAAAYACVALQGTDDEAWQSAVKAWIGGGRDFGGSGCLVGQVRETVTEILGAEPSPKRRPAMTLTPGKGLACPPTGRSLSPTEGIVGTRVTLQWTGAPWMHTASTAIRFGPNSAKLSFGPEGDRSNEVSALAPANEPGPQEVTVELNDGSVISFGSFTYRSS